MGRTYASKTLVPKSHIRIRNRSSQLVCSPRHAYKRLCFEPLSIRYSHDTAVPPLPPSLHFGQAQEKRLLLLGLDAAGKTSLLYKLHLNEFVDTIPTIGFNVESVEYNRMMMTIW